MDLAFEQYAQGSFESASNALMVYTAYLDSQEQRIASFRDGRAVDLTGKELDFTMSRDVPVMQLVPHSMLAVMMVYAGDTNRALLHFSRAYKAHVQSRTKARDVARAPDQFRPVHSRRSRED
jgi:hypothetical protein